jgi:segregation and condensation protein A
MTYQIKLEQFEGPLDLLLNLIEEEKLDITHLSLAGVADQYLAYIKNNEKIQLENLADFLSVASKLILIKSKALLPFLQFTEEEEEEIKDLAEQLEAYKKFKEAAKKIKVLDEAGKRAYSREGYVGVGPLFYPPENINAFDLKKYFQLILADIPVIEKLEEEFVKEIITLEEKIVDLQKVLQERVEVSFAEFAGKAGAKVDVIVSFLAVLEMVKQKVIEVEQNELFQEIKMKASNKSEKAESVD